MQDERREPLAPREVLLLEVQKFFNENLYGTWQKPFRLAGFADNDYASATRPEVTTYICVLNGVEDITGEPDWEWMRKLREFGEKYEVELLLDSALFEQ